jgi:hypothetical protein
MGMVLLLMLLIEAAGSRDVRVVGLLVSLWRVWACNDEERTSSDSVAFRIFDAVPITFFVVLILFLQAGAAAIVPLEVELLLSPIKSRCSPGTLQNKTRSNTKPAVSNHKKSLEPRVATKLLKQAKLIDRDGPVMLKQIIENTFVTTTPTTFATKTELFTLHLKNSKHNIVTFHEDVREKVISLEAVGLVTADIDLVVSLFMAYETFDDDLFKLEVCLLKSEYDRSTLTSSDELMEATKARYDELVKTNKWKATKPKEDPNLIALTATVKTLRDALQAKKGDKSGGSSNRQRGGAEGQGSWKFDPSLGSDRTYSRKIEGKDPKAYKWCTGPGHGGKPMWVCGHEPGAYDENYKGNDRNSSHKSTPTVEVVTPQLGTAEMRRPPFRPCAQSLKTRILGPRALSSLPLACYRDC